MCIGMCIGWTCVHMSRKLYAHINTHAHADVCIYVTYIRMHSATLLMEGTVEAVSASLGEIATGIAEALKVGLFFKTCV